MALCLLPAAFVGVAELYERAIVGRQRDELARAADAAADPSHQGAVAAALHGIVARLDARGASVARADAPDARLPHSALGTVGERLVGAGAEPVTVAQADALAPPWPARPEVQAALAGQRTFGRHLTPGGEALLVTLAVPQPPGVLYLIAGSHRGVRRLALVQRQLAELLIYVLALALPVAVWFGIRLVRPLERLAAGARRYPAAPLADAALLRRRDEIGALARTLAQMAADLDARRRDAVELGADIAHELKNPLASIAAAAELLTGGKAPNPERLALVNDTIATSVERLRRSIDELLRLLRLEHALPGEARAALAPAALLRALADEYGRDPRYAGWTFDVVVAPDAEEVVAPLAAQRWQEMLRNLVDNALVQPPRERRLVLGLARAGDALVTSVRDHGPGISPENQQRIWKRFFTQRPAGSPPGTGLGLSIVDSIARAHGARVEVVSAPGDGAEFRVVLPV